MHDEALVSRLNLFRGNVVSGPFLFGEFLRRSLKRNVLNPLFDRSGSNCRNPPRYPVFEWEMMNLKYASTGRIAGRIAADVCLIS